MRVVFFIIFVIILLRVTIFQILIELLELQCLTSKPADSVWDKFLLDVFSDRVI